MYNIVKNGGVYLSNKIVDRIKKSSPINQELFNMYLEQIPDLSEVKNYRSAFIRLVESISHKNLYELTLEDIENFLPNNGKISYFNNQIEYVKHIVNFLNSKRELSFKVEEINQLKFSTQDIAAEKRNAHALAFEEIIKIRKKLSESNMYTLLLVFELGYQLGIKKFEDIVKYNKESYNENTHTFKIGKNTEIIVPKSLQNIIDLGGLPEKQLSISTYNNYIKRIGEVINRDIIWKDITETRKINFMICPRCKNAYENKPENWIIYEYDDDKSMWIVCSTVCYMEVKNNKEN